MGMMEDPDDLGLPDLSAGVQVTKDGMVRENYRTFSFFFFLDLFLTLYPFFPTFPTPIYTRFFNSSIPLPPLPQNDR